jgi:tetratricopeptide (TPR) repeat protein/tRNA A-37 threonylcarbamoyl transferase component Bud32
LGRVYVARDEELGREVALKEIRPDRAAEEHLRTRFLLEAEINGGLEHPGIVPVYSLGDRDGRPFYAMRFVEGDSLKEATDAYHRAHPRPDPGAVEFHKLLGRFIDVCEAIAFAHSKGVLHRDLKPHNVMLGRYGETLVIDWGLAKATGRREPPGPGSAVEEALTPPSGSGLAPTIGVLGSPAYMSPEQAAGATGSLGRATDVYGLGAILYALLTGEPPVAGATTDELLDGARRGAIRPPRSLNPNVPRALQAVCLKALATDLVDRYPTAEALAAEVEHWLADEPVEAGGETVRDRQRRWSRRNRSLVRLAVACALVLLVNLGLMAWVQIHNIERERFQARLFDIERAAARSERARAAEKEQISRTLGHFIVKLFQTTDPVGLENRGFSTPTERMNTIAALQMLEVGVEQVKQPLDLGDSGALVRATLIDTIGNALRAASDFRRARPLLEEALHIRAALLPPDDPDRALSLFHVAMLDHFSGRFETAERAYLDAIAILERAPDGPENLALLDKVEFHYAWALAEMKRLAEAAKVIDRVVAGRKQRLGKDHADTRHAQFASYIIKLGSGERDVLLRQVVELTLTKDPIVQAAFRYLKADAWRKRADHTRDWGDVENARRQLEEVLSFVRTVLPQRHYILALLLGDMAEFENNHDNVARALALIEEAFDIARQVAPTHHYFIDALGKYAEVRARRREYDAAERALLEALDAIIARDDRARRADQFGDYLGRLLDLPKYRDDPRLAAALRKKYE